MDKETITEFVRELMHNNQRTHDGYQYPVPSPQTYPYQWFWDSCFHAITLTHLNNIDAKKEILSILSRQFTDGMIPHIIYWDRSQLTDFPLIEWGNQETSTITQPPMIAYSVLQIYNTDSDKSFLKETYNSLSAFYKYFIDHRDPRKNHLIGIINPDESGEDDSPRFDTLLNLEPQHSRSQNFNKRLEFLGQHIECKFNIHQCMRNFFWVKDVPFNAILVENLRCMSSIAKTLGYNEDIIYFNEQADLITEAMRKFMYEDGIFWSTYDLDYKKIKTLTWSIFSPLFAGILTDEEAKNIVDKYLKNENKFNTKFSVPTVAVDEVSYNPDGFWRGPVWMATNWFIFKGLMRYGFVEEAKKILDSSLDLIEQSGFREQYNPNTGEGLGAKDFTWGGLILDMDISLYKGKS